MTCKVLERLTSGAVFLMVVSLVPCGVILVTVDSLIYPLLLRPPSSSVCGGVEAAEAVGCIGLEGCR